MATPSRALVTGLLTATLAVPTAALALPPPVAEVPVVSADPPRLASCGLPEPRP